MIMTTLRDKAVAAYQEQQRQQCFAKAEAEIQRTTSLRHRFCQDFGADAEWINHGRVVVGGITLDFDRDGWHICGVCGNCGAELHSVQICEPHAGLAGLGRLITLAERGQITWLYHQCSRPPAPDPELASIMP